MKKLIVILIVALFLTACGPKHQDIVYSWQEALNKGDKDAALSYLAEDVVVTMIPPGPDGDSVYEGRDEVGVWYETIIAGKGVGALNDCQVDGYRYTCVSNYTDEGLKAMGVDFIEGNWVGEVQDGKIQSYTFTILPDSLAKFPPPPEPTPATSKVVATQIEDIAGIWDSKVLSERGYHYFKPDGTLILAYLFEQLETKPVFAIPSKYWFEGSTFHVEDSCGYGTYEVTVTRENDNPIKLHFEKLDDTCEQRAKDWKGDMRWVNP